MISVADALYDEYLNELRKEGFMARKFSELEREMSAEALGRSEARAETLLTEMALHELRQARGLSQKELADRLHVQQPAIAKLEQRTDMYISTLRGHIAAMGGELEIVAKFSEGNIKIRDFSSL